jgi:hypothetical protein
MDTYVFWRDLLERIIRNVLQTALPIVSAVAATGKGVDLAMTAVALGAVVVFTFLKGVAGVVVPADAPLSVQLLDRAGSAVAATLLAFLPEAALHSWADWASVDWKAVALAAGGSAVAALVSFYGAPPALARGNFDQTSYPRAA